MSTDVTAEHCGVCGYDHSRWVVDVEGGPNRILEIHEEALAWQRLRSAITDVVEAVDSYPYMWNIGDGCGGRVLGDIYDAFHAAGFQTESTSPPPRKTKKQLPAKLRAQVLARDGLRCKHCGCDDIDQLAVDHIIAEANGGAHTLDNLQTLCHSCNGKKGTS